ncbi:DUF421 domain-containing protein [Haloferula chungangensis]|uniref:DUF421 domain-containing protein n=1 Tax=Haloferula chungangensis TaxID=1048331 RepID=A0ABW2L8Q8_9BACT
MFISLPQLDIVLRVMILGPVSLIWIAVVVRLIGLRSFSKMTAFDFITTVATGSLLASAAAASEWSQFLQASGAVAALLALQAVIAALRVHSTGLIQLLENEPLLLMEDGVVIRANMTKARVSEDDLRAKLREANVLRYSDVRAVVLETTGDISVLHGEKLDEELLKSVRR